MCEKKLTRLKLTILDPKVLGGEITCEKIVSNPSEHRPTQMCP